MAVPYEEPTLIPGSHVDGSLVDDGSGTRVPRFDPRGQVRVSGVDRRNPWGVDGEARLRSKGRGSRSNVILRAGR